MPEWDESKIKQKMQQELEPVPDYEAMWSRIQKESKQRRSGWNQEKPIPPKRRRLSSKRQRAIACTCVTVAVIGIGFIGWKQAPIDTSVPAPTSAIQAKVSGSNEIQLIRDSGTEQNIQTTVINNDIGVKVNHARLQLDENQGSLATFNLTLTGLDKSQFNFANFGSAEIVDKQTNRSTSSTLNGFKMDRQFVSDEQFRLNGFDSKADKQQYVIKLKDLYLIQRNRIAFPNKNELGQGSIIQADKKFPVNLTSYSWSDNDRVLTIFYKENEYLTQLPGIQTPLFGMNAIWNYNNTNYVSLQPNAQQPSARIHSEVSRWQDGTSMQQFVFDKPLTEQQKEKVRLYYDYGTLVKQVSGEWQIPFSIDSK